MSYAATLLAAYPPSYGPSTLFSDDLVTRSSYDNLFQPAVPYMSSGRLLSDDLAFNQINHDATAYHQPPPYSFSNSTSLFPTTNYQNPSVTNRLRPIPVQNSFASLNDITEYSDSLATASNTNTASSVARSIDDHHTYGPMNTYSNYQQSYNPLLNEVDRNLQFESTWSSSQTKTKGQSNLEKPTLKNHSVPTAPRTKPSTVVQKKSSADELNNDLTPVPSPKPLPAAFTKQQNHLQRNATITEIEKPAASLNVQAWLNESKIDSPIDEKEAEQVWSVKIGQLHMAQAQHEKDKAKSSRALPTASKKLDNKPVGSKTKPTADIKTRDNTFQTQNDTYFDSLFDGDFFRKPSTNNYTVNSSIHQSMLTRNKPTTNSFNAPSTTALSKNPKYVLQRKTPRYEPPTTKRAPPTITTTSWRKQWPKEYHYDSMYPYYLNNEFTHRDFTQKDTDERYREALQKLRADRAEQKQKEINETTAKRLHYGDYVRHSTKDALLQNVVKPSPWSDFMHLKKGNLYSLSKEEKKQLYNQSKSYGERVRYRNFAIHYDAEARSHRHSVPLIDDVQESQSGYATPRRTMNDGGSKSVSRTSRRPDSGSTIKTTNKSYAKQTGVTDSSSRMISNKNSRTNRASEDEDGNLSDYDTNRKSKQQSKKKNVRYAKYDSSGRTTSITDESDNENDTNSQRNMRLRNRNNDDDLFTVREEKTFESLEDARYKRR